MTSNTNLMRGAWGPPCTNHPGWMRPAYRELDRIFKKWAYVLDQTQCGAANCRKITGGTGYSLHAYFDGEVYVFYNGVRVTMAVAVDINWRLNPYGPNLVTNMPRGMIEEILTLRTNSGHQVWGWGGYYSGNKDAMHFELHCTPAQLATGIRSSSTSTPAPGGKILAEFNIELDGPMVSRCYPKGGGIIVATASGQLRGIDTAVVGQWGMPKGQSYWEGKGFRLARVRLPTDEELRDIRPGILYVVVAETRQTYHFGP